MKKIHFLLTGDSCHAQRRSFIKHSMLVGSSILIYGGCEQKKEEVPLFYRPGNSSVRVSGRIEKGRRPGLHEVCELV